MRIVVCVKEVLDPDAVNSYALAGRLEIGADGRSLTQSAIPRLMNGYDEQALEAALRLRDAGADCRIEAVSIGPDSTTILKHAAALGADAVTSLLLAEGAADCHVVAALLAAWVQKSGGADLVLCGRQASDDDQGVVPALLCERLGVPLVVNARAVERVETAAGPGFRVVCVTPDGDEGVEVAAPAVVTVSSELGTPRYPTAARKLAARKVQPAVVAPESLGLAEAELRPRVVARRQLVPAVQGHCERIEGGSPAEIARALVARLRADRVIP